MIFDGNEAVDKSRFGSRRGSYFKTLPWQRVIQPCPAKWAPYASIGIGFRDGGKVLKMRVRQRQGEFWPAIETAAFTHLAWMAKIPYRRAGG
jgi:hypothetical protein